MAKARAQRYAHVWRAVLAASLLIAILTTVVTGSRADAAVSFGNITVSNIGTTSATLNGSVAPDGIATTAWFAYSVSNTVPLGSSTPSQNIGSGTAPVQISTVLTGLTPGTLYYVQLVAQSSSTPTYGPLATFTTVGSTTATVTPMTMRDGRAGVNLTGVSCPQPSRCWAVGDYSTRRNTYGVVDRLSGGAWLPSATTDVSLAGVDCLSVTSCWAVGSVTSAGNESPAAVHFNGRSWVRVAVPEPPGSRVDYFMSVTCTTAASCWAVGGMDGASALGRVLVEHYNGRSWSVVASPGPGDDSLLNAVSCTSARSCWAVGIANDFGAAPPIDSLVEHWNGTSWSPTKTPNVHYGLTDVSCRWAASCFAIGSKLLRLSNGSWRLSPMNDISYSFIDCSTSSSCWATTSYGGQTQHWNGATWTTAVGPTPPSGQLWNLDALTCAANGSCVAVGEQIPKSVRDPNSLYVSRAVAQQTGV